MQHADPPVRARICAHLGGLFGIALDGGANGENGQRISSNDSRVPVLVCRPMRKEGSR